MKVQLNKFVKIIETLSLDWELSPLSLNFKEKSIELSQADPSMTYAVIATVNTNIFQDYESVGEIKLTKEQVKMLKKMFKVDEYVDFKVDENKLRFSGKEETLELEQTDEKVTTFTPDIVTRSYGTVLAKPKVIRAYFVDLSYLSDIGYEKVLKFEFGDKLHVVVSSPTFKYTKAIPYFRTEGTESGSATLISDIVETIAGIKDRAWLIFTEGPVEIYYECEDYKALYVLSQAVL